MIHRRILRSSLAETLGCLNIVPLGSSYFIGAGCRPAGWKSGDGNPQPQDNVGRDCDRHDVVAASCESLFATYGVPLVQNWHELFK